MPEIKLVPSLYDANFRQIPEMLRKLAADIEQQNNTLEVIVILELNDNTIQVRSFGDTDYNSTVTTINRGLKFLLNLLP